MLAVMFIEVQNSVLQATVSTSILRTSKTNPLMTSKPVSETVLAQTKVVLDQAMTRRKLVQHLMCLS